MPEIVSSITFIHTHECTHYWAAVNGVTTAPNDPAMHGGPWRQGSNRENVFLVI